MSHVDGDEWPYGITAATTDQPATGQPATGPAEPRDSPGAGLYGQPLARWARRRRVVLVGIALIAAQVAWKAYFLGHFFFWQDDYQYLNRALDSSFTWRFLTQVEGGHLTPGLNALSWVLARVALYDWGLASFVTLAILAGAGLAALWLLKVLFGDRPVILIPLIIYLLTPLTLADLGWWVAATESLPLQLAIFMALATHVHYVRTGRFRYAVAACAWTVVGMLFFEKSVALPLLLFAVTSAFLVDGHWLSAARSCLVRYWPGWTLYAVAMAAYAALFVIVLHTSGSQPGSPGAYRGALGFISDLLRYAFLPGALGGPWHWSSSGSYAYAAPPVILAWLSWIAAACVVTASIVIRRHSWRAWAILAGWLVLADMVPVLLGRTRVFGAIVGLDTRYVADAAPVLAICVGLAFLPVVGRPELRRQAEPASVQVSQLATAVTAAVLGAFVIGSLVSVQAYQSVTTGAPARSFIANARAALKQAPAGTVIVDTRLPPTLLAAALFGRYGFASKVVGDMALGDHRVHWTRQPQGTINSLLAFGADGRLRPVKWYGALSPVLRGSCYPAKHRTIVVQLYANAVNARTVRIDYLTKAAGVVTVVFGAQSQQVAIKGGLNSVYVPVHGSSNSVVIKEPTAKQVCVSGAAAGVIFPSNTGPAIPAFPVTG